MAAVRDVLSCDGSLWLPKWPRARRRVSFAKIIASSVPTRVLGIVTRVRRWHVILIMFPPHNGWSVDKEWVPSCLHWEG